ncbi:hypothetical protein E1H13_15130 [Nodosilinea sp. P-1105]|nr:hypothetical protein [Nodosilinea sp. P-1105]
MFVIIFKMFNSNLFEINCNRIAASVLLPFLSISLIACGESAGSRIPGEHQQLFMDNLSRYSLDYVDSTQECNALPEVAAIGGNGTGFSANYEVLPNTLQLSSYEEWEEQTMIGDIEVIQVSYNGRYDLTCVGQGGSGAQERGRQTTGEVCLTGYLSLYKQRGTQNYEIYSDKSEILSRSC